MPARRRGWRAGRALAVLVVTALAVAGTGGVWAGRALATRNVDTGDALAAIQPGAPVNYLIVGSDSRAGITAEAGDDGSFGEVDGQRSDTMMILRIDRAAGRAAILSLPRDLYVRIAGTTGRDRLNAAYPRGPRVLVATISGALGIPVHHYLEVDFLGFKHLVDAVGGVRTCFPQPVKDDNTGLLINVAGCYTLAGLTALQYTRSRHLQIRGEDGKWREDPTADLGRIARQQAFMKDALRQAVSVGLSDPTAVPGLTAIVNEDLSTDSGFAMARFGAEMRSVDLDHLAAYTPPVRPDTMGDGKAVLRLLDGPAAPLLALFATGRLTDLPPTGAATDSAGA